MDFDDDSRELAALAADIFGDLAMPERVRAVERGEGGHDVALWKSLAGADLVGAALPQEVGGSGLGMVGLCALLEQQGRHVAPVPLAPVITSAAWPLVEHGTPGQKARWLARLLDGSSLITGAFEPSHQSLTTRSDGDGWIVTGELRGVLAAPLAEAVVAVVDTGNARRVAIIPADRDGVTLSPVHVTSQQSCGDIVLTDVALESGDLLDGSADEIVDVIRQRTRVANAALAVGVAAQALEITAAHTSQRHQFGRPLSSNQGVALRAADAHLDIVRMRLTMLRAAAALDCGAPDAAGAALVAAWWASVGCLRVVHTTQHLHGGVGADVDYPVHRYFLWGRQLSFSMGSAAELLAELADALTSLPPIGAAS